MFAFVNNIQRFCLHDGPGIRTTVFFQGCPLRCQWCANPETQPQGPVLLRTPIRCVGCSACLGVCQIGALWEEEGGIAVDHSRCATCGACVRACPTGAMRLMGEKIEMGDLLDILLRDERYYYQSGGGVTLSGGEPGLQPEFASVLMGELRGRKIHTTMETCGLCGPEAFAAMLKHCDTVLFDIKHMDTLAHHHGCGVGNGLILLNLEHAAGSVETIVRVPLIGGFNDDEENLVATANFVARLNIHRMDILPFHRLGASKYAGLGQTYAYADVPSMGAGAQQAAEILRNHSSAQVYIL